ncbi:hypothetical protein GLYMA_19G130300v4 [Glycine max]|uniref:Uncharacterized protein n=1 Tax=Glycine max TaxID=3847 RepID=A0A0R0EM74_SOYBN|nr:hypothetical protein GYH30_052918 [Glycine max]KAH1194574.1 hypothetical protein GmHk_19G055335 [Glycine max]KRG95104.1 hypothetical protein GLYMA_19G130300v4 [Glycine max]
MAQCEQELLRAFEYAQFLHQLLRISQLVHSEWPHVLQIAQPHFKIKTKMNEFGTKKKDLILCVVLLLLSRWLATEGSITHSHFETHRFAHYANGLDTRH